MCSGSEAGSYLRLIDFVYHSTLGLRVTQKKTRFGSLGIRDSGVGVIPDGDNLDRVLAHLGLASNKEEEKIRGFGVSGLGGWGCTRWWQP